MLSFYFHPDYGGSGIQAQSLNRHLLALGARPFVVSANLSGSKAVDEVEGIPVHRLPVLASRELQIPSFSVSLLKFLIAHRNDYDVIHAHGTVQHLVASIAGRWLKKPTLLKVAMANSDIAFPRQGRLRGPLNRGLAKRFDRYIATTPAIVDEFTQRGLDPAKVRFMPNGVDTQLFSPVDEAERDALRHRLGLPAGPIVTYMGIIIARKNVDGILRVWASCVRRGAAGHLVLLGPVPPNGEAFERKLRDYIAEHGLQDRVTFAGQQSRVAAWLQASDVFLFPSRQEGLPNSVLEAMACGLPCLISSAAGLHDVIQADRNGVVRDLQDEEGLADALGTLLSDPSLRQQLGSEARRTVANRFSLQALATQYYDLYEELCAERRRRPNASE